MFGQILHLQLAPNLMTQPWSSSIFQETWPSDRVRISKQKRFQWAGKVGHEMPQSHHHFFQRNMASKVIGTGLMSLMTEFDAVKVGRGHFWRHTSCRGHFVLFPVQNWGYNVIYSPEYDSGVPKCEIYLELMATWFAQSWLSISNGTLFICIHYLLIFIATWYRYPLLSLETL